MTQPLFDTWCSTCSAFSSSIHIDSCFSRPSLSLEIQHAKQSTINSGRPSLSLTSGTRHAPPSISTVHIDGSLGETLDVCEVQAMVISPRTHSQTRRVSRRAIHVTYQRLETCDTCNMSKTRDVRYMKHVKDSRRAIHETCQRLETCDTCNISKTRDVRYM